MQQALRRRPVEHHPSGVEHDHALTHALDRPGVVGDQDHGGAAGDLLGDAAQALALEGLVADGEDLVDQEDVGVEEGGDREAEA